MGQKHSAKYSLKQPAGGNNKQQTAQIEDEVAFNTDSPGRAPDDPVGVNLSSQQNDYIRNAAQAMAKVWTEKAVVESSAGNEEGAEGKKKVCRSDGDRDETKVPEEENRETVPKENDVPEENVPSMQEEKGEIVPEESGANMSGENAANIPQENEANVPEENVGGNTEEGLQNSMPNAEVIQQQDDAIQNTVEPEISSQEMQNVIGGDDSHSQPSDEPIMQQTLENENAVPDDQITSNPAECDEGNQQIVVGENEIQIQNREQGVDEAKMDLYEENGQNEGVEMDRTGVEKEVTAEILGAEMPIQKEEDTMEKSVEQNEEAKQNEEDADVQNNNLMIEIGEQQNPVLEGIADYVANQQIVHLDGNAPEEVKSVESESNGKENFVPTENQNGQENGDEQQQQQQQQQIIETAQGIEASKNLTMPIEEVDTIPAEKTTIQIGCGDELSDLKQNGQQQNECQQLVIGNGEPNSSSIGKPSEL